MKTERNLMAFAVPGKDHLIDIADDQGRSRNMNIPKAERMATVTRLDAERMEYESLRSQSEILTKSSLTGARTTNNL